MIVITGALLRKDTGKVLAVGEWEALDEFVKQLVKLNPSTTRKRDFVILQEFNPDYILQTSVVIGMGYGNQLVFGGVR